MKRLSILSLAGWLAVSWSVRADPSGSATDGGLPPELLKEYLGKRPSAHLIDPQQLLAEPDRKEFLRVLDAHAADSQVDVHLYLLAAEQSMPAEPAVGEFVDRVFSADPPSVVVYYVLGAPDRARMHASPRIGRSVAPGLLAAMLKGCVAAALEQERPNRQLEAFIDMLVVRVCSMERLLESGKAAVPATLVSQGEDVLRSSPQWEGVVAAARRHAWWLAAHPWPLFAVPISLFAIALLWISRRLLSTHLFPPIEVRRRLGAPHAADVGVVIAFSNPKIPPAMQREDPHV